MKIFNSFKKFVTFLVLSIPMLSGCSTNANISGSYYLFDNDGYHKETYYRIADNKWEDQSGSSGTISMSQVPTGNSNVVYNVQFKSKGSIVTSASYMGNYDYLLFEDSFGACTYFCKEDSNIPEYTYLPTKITNKTEFIGILNHTYNPRYSTIYQYDIMNDIDLEGASLFTGATSPSEYRFCINGKGHTIKNFSVNSATDAGLFPHITKSKILNLKIADAYICGDKTGALTGTASSSYIENVTIESNVRVGDGSKAFTGGIAGLATEATQIKNCTNKGAIDGKGTVGGIVGKTNNSSVIGCTNSGNVTAYINGACGGIVGYYYQYWESYDSHTEYLENNNNYGTINGNNFNKIGGIVGSIYREKPTIRLVDDSSPLTVSNCINYGNVSGNNDIGGIAGIATSKDGINTLISFTNCSNKGNVNGYEYVGGILGAGQASNAFSFCTNDYNEQNNNGVFGCYYVGGIAGVGNNFSSCKNNGLVAFVKAENTLDGFSEQKYLGGIASDSYVGARSVATNCENAGVVRGYVQDQTASIIRYRGNSVGGIYGLFGGGNVINCKNSGSIHGTINVGGLVGTYVPTYSLSVNNCEVSGLLNVVSGGPAGGFIGLLAYSDTAVSPVKHYSSTFSLFDCVIKDFTANVNSTGSFGYCIGSAFSNSTSAEQYGKAILKNCEVNMVVSIDESISIKPVRHNSSLNDVDVLNVQLDYSKINVTINVI